LHTSECRNNLALFTAAVSDLLIPTPAIETGAVAAGEVLDELPRHQVLRI